jgi:lipoate-protein ligase A
MACNTRIVRTRSADPWWNLSVGEYLLEQAAQDETILYLWQNDNTVVVGRNQDPCCECRTDLLEGDGGRLARRISGGGAVYQDLGSLNFAFISGSGAYDPDRQFETLMKAAKSLGIDAEQCGEGELAADGRRFSDSVFCFIEETACHHGTIHVSTDIDRLLKYLQPASGNMCSDADKAAGPQIINLCELKPGLDVETVADALIDAFREVYDSAAQVENTLRKCSESRAALEDLYCKYSSWVWRYGKTDESSTKVETVRSTVDV